MQTRRGLPGLVSRATSVITPLLENAVVRIFTFCVVGAAVIGIYQHVIEKAPQGLDFWRLLLLGLGAITAEFLGVHKLITSWHSARPVAMLAWVGIWFVGVNFAMYNVLSTGAAFQAKQSGLQKASFNTSINVESAVVEARKRVQVSERVHEDMAKLTLTPLPNVDGVPVNSVVYAEAIIAGQKAKTRFWNDLTDGCTKTGGKDTRAFCETYKQAVAAKADLDARKDWDGKLANAMTDLKEARTQLGAALKDASETKTVTSDTTPFVSLVANISGRKAEDVAWLEPIQVSLINMLLVSLAGFVSALAAIEGKTRTKFINWSPAKAVARSIYMSITGKTALEVAHDQAARGKVVEVQTHTREVIKDEGVMARMRAHAQANAPHLMVAN